MRLRFCILMLAIVASWQEVHAAEVIPKPGPENAGLRLRFQVTPQQTVNSEKYNVQVDVINVSKKPITMAADWPHDEPGDFAEYVQAATSIRTHPEIMLWGIQVMEDRRSKPQPRHTLAPNETLTVKWTSKNRRLKNKNTRPDLAP